MANDTTAKIRELNDQTRQQCMMPIFGHGVPCRILMTQGIQELGPIAQIEIAAMVRDFDKFTADNDPYGEHDFGSFDFEGKKIFWKIDYYDNSLEMGSENPADLTQTVRVLTIMRAVEY